MPVEQEEEDVSEHLVKTGFQQSIADPSVFFKWKNGKLNVVSIYVDDLILVVDMLEDLQKTKAELSARFKMKDLGQLRYCLGIVCDVSDGKICINQKPYIDNLVRRFGLSDACGVSTPADACVKLVADDGVSRSEAVSADSGKSAVRRRRNKTRHCICGEHSSEVRSPTVGAAHDSCQTYFEVPETNKGPQSDVCEGFSGGHRGLFRC